MNDDRQLLYSQGTPYFEVERRSSDIGLPVVSQVVYRPKGTYKQPIYLLLMKLKTLESIVSVKLRGDDSAY